MKNKVKFGLKNVHYAIAKIDETDNSATYEQPVKWPGAVSLSLEAKGSTEPFYADDGVYFTSTANNGYEGDLETALVPDSFRQDVLGEILDKNGVFVEDVNALQVCFALLFEFNGDKKGRRHVMYNCVATRPSVGSVTKGESVEVQKETVKITAAPIHSTALGIDIAKAYVDADSAAYADWFTKVYLPEKAEEEV